MRYAQRGTVKGSPFWRRLWLCPAAHSVVWLCASGVIGQCAYPLSAMRVVSWPCRLNHATQPARVQLTAQPSGAVTMLPP